MSEVARSADVAVKLILEDPKRLALLQGDPEGTLKDAATLAKKMSTEPAYWADEWAYRIVLLCLGAVALAAMIGAIVLSALSSGGAPVQIPDVLTALGAAAIGALAGVLAPSPARTAGGSSS
jgi:hypothetical protein